MMHDVQMVSDFQPTHRQRSLSTCATTELPSRQCCFAQSLPHGWPARHTVCDTSRALPNMSIPSSTAASVDAMQCCCCWPTHHSAPRQAVTCYNPRTSPSVMAS
eukprot:1392906-Amphidinium_carterae.1